MTPDEKSKHAIAFAQLIVSLLALAFIARAWWNGRNT